MDGRNESEPLWTADEVARFIGLHPQTVYEKSRLGEIPSIKIGSRLRFRPAEIRAWVDAQAAKAASVAPTEKAS